LNFVRIIHITHFQFRNRNYRSASKSNKNPLTRSRLVSHILVDTAVTQRPTHPLTLRPRSISSDRHVGVDRSVSLPRCRGWHDVSPRHASHLSSPVHAMSLCHCAWVSFSLSSSCSLTARGLALSNSTAALSLLCFTAGGPSCFLLSLLTCFSLPRPFPSPERARKREEKNRTQKGGKTRGDER
jgi:hypothetical protein